MTPGTKPTKNRNTSWIHRLFSSKDEAGSEWSNRKPIEPAVDDSSTAFCAGSSMFLTSDPMKDSSNSNHNEPIDKEDSYGDDDDDDSQDRTAPSLLLDASSEKVFRDMISIVIQRRRKTMDGCIWEPNVYEISNLRSKQLLMVAKEESDRCSRGVCGPDHSFFLKFYLVEDNRSGITLLELEATRVPFMSYEREGRDCSCRLEKKQFGRFCGGFHTDGKLYKGHVEGTRDRKQRVVLGKSVRVPNKEWKCCFPSHSVVPKLQLMDRLDDGNDNDNETNDTSTHLVATTGPLEERWDASSWRISWLKNDWTEAPILHMVARSDEDRWEVHFKDEQLTSRQKATALSQVLHMSYLYDTDGMISHE